MLFFDKFSKMDENKFNIYELADNYFVKFIYYIDIVIIITQLNFRRNPHVGFRDINCLLKFIWNEGIVRVTGCKKEGKRKEYVAGKLQETKFANKQVEKNSRRAPTPK